MDCLSRSLSRLPIHVDHGLLAKAFRSMLRVPLSHTNTNHHVLVTFIDEFDR